MTKHWSIFNQATNVPIVTDEKLLEDCARGDRGAQYRLYSQCYSFMMSICIRYCNSRDDAEDLLNRGFLKVLNSIGKRRKEVPFPLWMRRIMINTIIDEYRKKKLLNEQRELVDFDDREHEADGTVINSYVEKMNAEQLQVLIDTLPETSKRIFNLFAVDGYSHKEIAAMTGMSEGTSKWHVNNARTRLKELIAKNHLYHNKSIAS